MARGLAAGVAVGATLLAPVLVRADLQGFAAGALIIPMDACYQAAPDVPRPSGCVDGKAAADDGAVAAYGVVHLLLRRGVPVAVAVKADKADLAAADFSITDPSGAAPVQRLARPGDGVVAFTSQSTLSYRGGPFLIDAADAPQARALLTSELAGASTAVHVARVPFTAPVALRLVGAPSKLALVDVCNGALGCPKGGAPASEGIPLLQAYLRRAGLDTPGNIGALGTPGAVADVVTLDDINQRGALATGRYGLAWLPHYAAPTRVGAGYILQTADLLALQRLTRFVTDGGVLLSTCTAVWSLEGGQDPAWRQYLPPAQVGSFLYDVAVNGGGGVMNQVNGCYPGNSGGFSAPLSCTGPLPPLAPGSGRGLASADPGNPLAQIGDFLFHDGFNLAPPQNLSNDIGNWDIKPGGAWRSEVLNLLRTADSSAADNAVALFSLAPQAQGTALYLGGHSYAEPGNLSTAGQRLVLNSLLFGRPTIDLQELSRSSAITSSDGALLYVGTFREPRGPSIFRSASDVAAWTFPASPGHLRQLTLSRQSGAVALRAGSEDWDAAVLLPPGPSRRVLTQTGEGASARFVDFTAAGASALLPLLALPAGATEADAAALIDAVRGGRLGGVDHSTLALVTSSLLVNGAQLRPTVAYVGALDGQLHAIGVAGAGVSPGVELWSFLPADQLPRLRDNSAGVDASPNARDLFDDWSGAGLRSWRTYLAVAEGAMGSAVHAIDVSDPLQPQLRWQRGTSSADGGVPLGGARGATWGLVAAAGVPGVSSAAVVATSRPEPGAKGFLVAALSGRDGRALWSFRGDYSRSVPGGGALVPNDIPAPPALADRARSGVEDTVYVGDYEGKLWELAAGLGSNSAGAGPLFDVGPTPEGHVQPIGAPLALYRDRSNGHLVVLAVTGGADWAAPGDSYALYAIDVEQVNAQTGRRGVQLFRAPIRGRGYAAPVVSGYDVYVVGSEGLLGQSGGALRSSLGDAGTLARVNLQSGQTTLSVGVSKSGGAVQVTADGRLAVSTVKDVQLLGNDSNDRRGGSLWDRQRLAFRLWLQPW